jgi:hypothetical protein
VDVETERQMQEALGRLTAGAPRLQSRTVGDAAQRDALIVLEKGEIIETGTHAELMEKKALLRPGANAKQDQRNRRRARRVNKGAGMTPEEITLFYHPQDRLRLTVKGNCSYLSVKPVWAAPLSRPNTYLSLLDGKSKEIVLLP